jgi:CDP-paratose 2-epimerase
MEARVERGAPAVPAERDGPVVITGGAGFIGTNLAERLLAAGREVVLFDSFARAGVEDNARWLAARHGGRVRIERGDVRDEAAVRRVLRDASAVFHFAAQVAVTTSLDDPLHDFEVNAGGTLRVLEAARRLPSPPPFLTTSTNKVYGALAGLRLEVAGGRYTPTESATRDRGVDERRPLDFHTPYGCSKGAADQYTLDYARAYGLPTLVFRMSCIYGQRQFGTEDQGWVAHLMREVMEGRPVTIYGDGRQVRDVLYVDDLIDAMVLAWSSAERLAGRAFNIGGGPANLLSPLELLDGIAADEGRPAERRFAEWRRGDQRYYVSDTSAFRRETGWAPRIGVREGIGRLRVWLESLRASAQPAGTTA